MPWRWRLTADVSSTIWPPSATARDLRLLLAVAKITANLERAGDEVCKIARMVKLIIDSGASRSVPSSGTARCFGRHLICAPLARRVCPPRYHHCFAVIKADDQIDHGYDGFAR